MEVLDADYRLFLEAEQETRAGLGRGTLRLGAESAGSSSRIEREWPWAFLPGSDYAAELQQIFPWADLSIDQKAYRKATYADFLNERARWNSATEEYECDEDLDDFSQWFDEHYTCTLKPYGRREGEDIALWRLQLRLNDFGREVLKHEHDSMYAEAMFDVRLEEERKHERASG